ncbi:MAG: sulfate adenylyltransferase subunit 1, partial [Thermoanaerobaculia bacterium]
MSISTFLEQYRKRELLRFLTCGSVDDGKSTLIGRLLHDSHGVYEDQLSAARRDSAKHGTTGGELDLALLVDGLQAEREQGITIDVAYRYFSTGTRKYIIADAPGHEQYTRNMATGASTCDLAVILVDATRGVLDQTRRHAFIATLLGIRHLVVAVNKMDLADYSQQRFDSIREDFAAFAAKLQVSDVHFIPMSALKGDNVVHDSEAMPWYRGGPLLDYLETLHIASDRNLIDLRLAVQLVARPNAEFRGYAGTIASGILRKGDEITVLPSGRRTRVREIHTVDGVRDQAFAPMPVTVTLADEVDASRGDMLVHPNNAPRVERDLEAMVVWMQDEPATTKREYLLKQTTVLVPAIVTDIRYRINV